MSGHESFFMRGRGVILVERTLVRCAGRCGALVERLNEWTEGT